MKTLNKMVEQHSNALRDIPLWVRLVVTLLIMFTFTTLVCAEAPAYLTGLTIALLAVGAQLLVDAWKLPEDWRWMTIAFIWYNILYTSLALLF